MTRWSRQQVLFLCQGLALLGFAVLIWVTVREPVRLVALIIVMLAALNFLLAARPPATRRR